MIEASIDAEEFRSGGVLPTAPVSLWPRERNEKYFTKEQLATTQDPANDVPHIDMDDPGAIDKLRKLMPGVQIEHDDEELKAQAAEYFRQLNEGIEVPDLSNFRPVKHDTKVKVGAMRMAQNLAKTTQQAVTHGKVSAEIRDERYETCKGCPHFIEETKRCSECGCFMEAKTWVGGDPNQLCPKQKWSR